MQTLAKMFNNKSHRKANLTLLFSLAALISTIIYLTLNSELTSSAYTKEEKATSTMQPEEKAKSTLQPTSNGNGYKIPDAPCIVPKLNPFNPAIKKFMLPPQHIDCTVNNHPLLFTTDLDSNLIVVQDPKDFGYENCCYTPFSRDGSDYKETYSTDCYAIHGNKAKVPPPREFVAIYCQNNTIQTNYWFNRTSSVVDMLNFVHLKPEAETRSNSFHNQESDLDREPNVVILGLDSVSHMNFIRMMPNTLAYLTKNLSAIGMNGYSTIGENTFPNVVPVLTGMTANELKPVCWNSTSDYFDDCPFIWKNFSRLGYRTAYAEDYPSVGIFLYHKKGFRDQPTDHYLIPLLHALGTHPGNSRVKASQCYGPRLGFSILLNNMQKVLYTMGHARKYFQFTWATSLFHESHNLASAGDEKLKEFLHWMHNGNYLNNTIFILMSDHGARFGPFRETEQGRLESRMPFLYFVFPEWFSTKYKVAVSNVRLNQDRLTTPLDLHQTLKDLLDLKQIEDNQIHKRDMELNNSSTTIPRAISLFLQVPDATKRKCQDAGIELHFCACSPPAAMSTSNSIVLQGANVVVKSINKMLVQQSSCAQLSLDFVMSAYEVFNSTRSSSILPKSYAMNNTTLVIVITIKTTPNDAVFEATVAEVQHGKWIISGEISRINKYGNQSHCVNDYHIKPYCYCS